MNNRDWLYITAFIVVAFTQHQAAADRDEWKASAYMLSGMYNGLLIGRGCEVPE